MLVEEKASCPRRLRDHCPFTFRGHPATKPNTLADAQRIWLSQWITATLVRHGDELPGAYHTPGAEGCHFEEVTTLI